MWPCDILTPGRIQNTESTAALGGEACYSQKTERPEAIEGVEWDAADLVVAQDAGRNTHPYIASKNSK